MSEARITVNLGGKYSYVNLTIPVPLQTFYQKIYDKYFGYNAELSKVKAASNLFDLLNKQVEEEKDLLIKRNAELKVLMERETRKVENEKML